MPGRFAPWLLTLTKEFHFPLWLGSWWYLPSSPLLMGSFSSFTVASVSVLMQMPFPRVKWLSCCISRTRSKACQSFGNTWSHHFSYWRPCLKLQLLPYAAESLLHRTWPQFHVCLLTPCCCCFLKSYVSAAAVFLCLQKRIITSDLADALYRIYETAYYLAFRSSNVKLL